MTEQCFNSTIPFCLNGGICNETNLIIKECICPEGTQHDFTVFHSRNCGLVSQQLLPAFFSVVTCMLIPSVMFILYVIKTKRKWSSDFMVLTNLLAIVITAWLFYMFVFIDEGLYRKGLFFLCLLHICCNRVFVFLFQYLTTPLLLVLNRSSRSIKNVSYAIELLFDFVVLGFLISLSIYVDDEIVFNQLMVAYLLFLCCSLELLTLLSYIFVNTFTNLLRKSPSSDAHMFASLKQMSQFLIGIAFAFLLFIGIDLVFVGIGSLPYQFIIQFMIAFSGVTFCTIATWIIYGLKGRQTRQSTRILVEEVVFSSIAAAQQVPMKKRKKYKLVGVRYKPAIKLPTLNETEHEGTYNPTFVSQLHAPEQDNGSISMTLLDDDIIEELKESPMLNKH